jgi:sugar lactone lactonase YvrE
MNRIVAVVWITVGLLLPCGSWAQAPAGAGNIINTVVGGANPSSSALSADLGDPTAVTRDALGNTYIAGGNAYVFKEDTAGNLTVVTGQGWAGFGGTGGPATSATIGDPSGLALDNARDLFIADSSNHVWMVSASTGKLVNIAGSSTFLNPFGGYSGDGGPPTLAQLNGPSGLALESNKTLFIADSGNEVIRVIRQGVINTYAGNGMPCPDPTLNPACGDGGSALNANLTQPVGLAVDAQGNLYIADAADNRVRRVDTNGIITTVAGNGENCVLPGCGDNMLATQANVVHPTGVFVDASGNLYIAGDFENRIRFVNAATQIITTVAGTGDFDFGGDRGPATLALLSNPQDVFVDSAGNMLIADSGNKRIRQVKAGIINTIAGGGLGGDNGPALGATLSDPLAVTLDSHGNQFIVDVGNSRIRRVDAITNKITTVAGTGNAGYKGDGGPATLANLNVPEGVAVDAAGDLFITDPGDKVVQRVDGVTQIMTFFAGTLFTRCPNSTDPCGDGGPATSATFAGPTGVAVDQHGNVFIADLNDSRIRCVIGSVGGCGDTQHLYEIGTILTVAGNGIPCFSPPDCGDGGPATSANLSFPFGLAVDAAGNLFIADEGDNLVRRVDAVTQIISTVAFNGQATFGGDGGPALNASMIAPEEVAVDPAGNLFIGGGLDEVVRRVDFQTQTITTVAGNPANPIPYGFKGDGGLATKATLDNFGVAADGNGNLYIADSGNNRIRSVHLVPAPLLSTKSYNFGNQILDTTSPPVDIPFSNVGLNDLQITNITSTGDFAQTNTCGTLLAPSLTCDIFITFTPRKLGIRQGVVTILDNGAGGTQKIALTGNGVGK